MIYQRIEDLWQASFETFYDAYFTEMVSEYIIDRWQFFDDITKVLVALTASGSAVTGWSLWNHPDLKFFWAILAGLSAVFAICHSALGVSHRIKYWSEIKMHFSGLRINLETLRYLIKDESQILHKEETEAELDGLKQDFIKYRRHFNEGTQRIQSDIFKTNRLLLKVQKKLDRIIVDLVINDE